MPNLHTLNPDEKFAQLSNYSIDDLTLIGAGYLANLLRHEDGWVPALSHLVGQKKAGRDAARGARRELLSKGYYVKVSFKYDGGKNASDIWRSVYPHQNSDLDRIASYYQRGSTWQIPLLDDRGRPQRDASGRTLTRPVTVQWAEMESWRDSKERIAPESAAGAADAETAGHPRGADSRPPGDPASPPGGGFPTPGQPTPGNPPPIKKTREEHEEEDDLEPFGDAQKVPDLQKAYEKTAGHSANGVPMQGDQVGESLPLRARARSMAGTTACQAFDADPWMLQSELAGVIRQDQPGLSHGQAVGRAANLIATHDPAGPPAPPVAL